jgi:peroxiredoxin
MRRTFAAGALAATLMAFCTAAAAQASAPAAPMPTLQGQSLQATPVDLRALRGKVVLVFFWSTDCPVCLDKLPELRRNLEGWRGRDFAIVAVNQDRARRDLADYEKVLDRLVPPNPQMTLMWRREASHRDGFGELPLRMPTAFVLDRRGALVKTLNGRLPPEFWDDIAELVLN